MPRLRPRSARATQVFHALAEPTRLAILDRLRGGEHCVCNLQDLLDAGQSRLSFHLKVLREAGLVTDRREGRWVYYTLDAELLEESRDLLSELLAPVEDASRSKHDRCC